MNVLRIWDRSGAYSEPIMLHAVGDQQQTDVMAAVLKAGLARHIKNPTSSIAEYLGLLDASPSLGPISKLLLSTPS